MEFSLQCICFSSLPDVFYKSWIKDVIIFFWKLRCCLSQKNELTENGSLVCGRETRHDGHEEDGHVQHGGDAQGDLLTRLSRDQEHKPDNSKIRNKRHDLLFITMTFFTFWAQKALASLVAISGPKTVSIFRAYSFQWPSKWICPHQNYYVPRHINN